MKKDDTFYIENIIKDIEKFGRENDYPIILDESKDFILNEIKNTNVSNILEIGTCIGYSGSLLLLNCKQANLTTIEKNEDVASIAKENFTKLNLDKRVNLIVEDAKVAIEKLQEKYDLIFLDGPKAQYKNYLPILIKLLNVGGVLIADNVLFKGFVNKDENEFLPRGIRSIVRGLRIFLQEVTTDERLTTKVYDVGDGISVSKKIKE